MKVRARSPLRLGLAGGGTDISPYCDTYGGYALNVTINRYAYATLKPLSGKLIRIAATDLNDEEITDLKSFLPLEGKLRLHKAVYNHMVSNYNEGLPIGVELITYCDAPKGSGLGSSSTLVVTIIKAFIEYLNIPLNDYEISFLAYKIERIDCGFDGGKQDHYSATFGGVNFIEFYENNKTIVNTLRIKNHIISEFESSILLYFTGISRNSSDIITDQISNIRRENKKSVEALHILKEEALTMKESLLLGNFDGIVNSMRIGWESKKRTANSISNPMIDAIYESAICAGADAGKVSGAGGGGFLWFYVSPENRHRVITSLNQFGGIISNCQFEKRGAVAWHI
jgi:D-glycero-alpha-D-manno-heptose-7-phosphate kinase